MQKSFHCENPSEFPFDLELKLDKTNTAAASTLNVSSTPFF